MKILKNKKMVSSLVVGLLVLSLGGTALANTSLIPSFLTASPSTAYQNNAVFVQQAACAYSYPAYYYVGTTSGVDGYYGSGTTRAVKEIQADYGITQDGITGPNTYSKIASFLSIHQTVGIYKYYRGPFSWYNNIRYSSAYGWQAYCNRTNSWVTMVY